MEHINVRVRVTACSLEAETADFAPALYHVHPERYQILYPRSKQAVADITSFNNDDFCQLSTTCLYWQDCICNRLGLPLLSLLKLR